MKFIKLPMKFFLFGIGLLSLCLLGCVNNERSRNWANPNVSGEVLVQQLQWMKLHAATGFFINDLQRHPLAYYSIKLLTRLFSRSYLVKHDAPLSVARGFSRAEWEQLFSTAGLQSFIIQWRWAFRYLIIFRTHER